MPALTRQTKITFAEMRAAGVRGLLIYCSDCRCSHSTTMSADGWSDDIRLSDIEPLFTCQVCGERGADEYRAGLERAMSNGWLIRHEAGTYVKLTPGRCGSVCLTRQHSN